MNFLLALLSVLSVVAGCKATCASSCLIALPFGKVQGKCVNGMCFYTNIPYALPPTGDLRLEAPVRYNLKWSGIRDGTKDPIPCVQFSPYYASPGGSENCLFIHVYTPGTGENINYRVRVYIHGGAFMYGSPGDVDPTLLVQNNMIVVTFGYRLGPLGFLSTNNQCIPGNNGLKDQRLALRWIKQYIQYFHGLPDKILLSGSDAGGASVHLHMLRKEKLFNGAMATNGVALNKWVFQERPVWQYAELATNLKCTLLCPPVKDCIRSKSVQEIVDAVNAQYVFRDLPSSLYGPVVEDPNTGAFLTEQPEAIIKSGRAANVTFLIAYAEREGSYTAAEWMRIGPEGNARIGLLEEKWPEYGPIMLYYNDTMAAPGRDQHSTDLKEKYFGNRVFRQENYCMLEDMFTDLLYMEGIKRSICLHRQYGCGKLFVYKYKYPHTFGMGNILSERADIAFGPDHGSDGIFSLSLKSLKLAKLAPNEQRIASRLILLQKALANGNAVYDGRSLPLNTPNKSGTLIIKKNCHEIEYCQAAFCDECI